MEKGFTRTGRRSKFGTSQTTVSEDAKQSSELVNGGSDKVDDLLKDAEIKSNSDDKVTANSNVVKMKEENKSDDSKAMNSESTEFHGFDEPSIPSAVSVVNQLVGKFEADLEDQDSSSNKGVDDGSAESLGGHKVLGHDIYTDSEDESSKPSKRIKEVKAASKKRPLEALAAELNDDEKPASPPPAKRARKKSAKAREALGDKNKKASVDVSAEVSSSADILPKSKAIKEESHSEVTSSAGTPAGNKSQETAGSASRSGRNVPRNIEDPIYLKPLEMGWRRELVYRKTEPKGKPEPKTGDKRTGDIYYYTPQGKKVRSRVEILEHLKDTGLTVHHFCFLKEPLGLKDESKEIIREASARKSVLDLLPAKKEKSPKIPKQKALKGASATESDKTSSVSGSNGTSTSPSNTPSAAKAGTPKVVLKATRQGAKPGPKIKLTPSRKANADTPPTKTKGVRAKKENAPVKDVESDVGMPTANWDTKDESATDQSPSNAAAPWKTKSHSGMPKVAMTQPCPNSFVNGMTNWPLQSVPRPPAPPIGGPFPSEPPTPPQTVATIGGQKFIVVPKHNVLSVSPGAARGITRGSSQLAASPSPLFVAGSGGVSNNPMDWPGLSTDLMLSKRSKTGENTDATVESTTVGTQGKPQVKRDMENFISDLSIGYGALFHVMGYLKVQELLRASRVCRMWRDLSLHPNLWHTVRMKNSHVSDWDGFAAALCSRGTRVLDLRKMLAPGRVEDIENMWSEFCRVIHKADSLQRVELSRCPASVVEQLAKSCPQLRVINAIAIKSEELDLEPLRKVPLLEELRLKSNNGINISRTLDPLLSCRLKHLSLTSVKNLGSCNVEVVSQLENLESLELGDCVQLSNSFGPDHLSKLTNLQRLRLEKGNVPECHVISIIESISKLPALKQLEIINFDVRPGFDKALGMCKQVRRLLIIPTYITTSAATNHIVLCSLPLLADSLECLVWGLTQELTKVTDLFIDQCEARKGTQGSNKLNTFPGECIPVINPTLNSDKDKEKTSEDAKDPEDKPAEKMDVDEEAKDKDEGKEEKDNPTKDKDDSSNNDLNDVDALALGFRAMSELEQAEDCNNGTPPVRILPIPKLYKLLQNLLPNTRVKILKVLFNSTWRQTFPEMSSF